MTVQKTTAKQQVKSLKGFKRAQDVRLTTKTFIEEKQMDHEIKEPADP